MGFKEEFLSLRTGVHIEKDYGSPVEFRAGVLSDPEVKIWLSKLGYKTHRGYIDGFCYFLRCANISAPSKLLDLKGYDDSKTRFFPAEQLVDYWIVLAKESGVPAYRIKKVVDAVRSFFKRNRVKLIDVSVSYKPKEKPALGRDDLLRFRENMTWHGRTVFDFLLSVPLRDGQFSVCKHCGRDFHPKWRNIVGFPRVEFGSAFVIQPEKGHESTAYSTGLRQVCFLTQTCADQLNALRSYRERLTGRDVEGSDYIFTYSQRHRDGEKFVSPIGKDAVKMLFYNTQPKAGLRVYPHYLRSYDNSVLAACGIDKQLRDVYLGHSCAYEEGYILQMIPLWQKVFQEKHALEALDVLNPGQHEILRLEEEVKQLRKQMDGSEARLLKWLYDNVLSDPEARKKLFGKKNSL